ncbi:TIGR03083 family protein [Klenkia soli]|uniref:TIGR03083 family protein n=1 Tax=Klenkia soli TaxID=1052260 RepID=A0A1H0MBL6_9ACTN|nr:maleylpyruvate isomerase family mycothiol-dependent enzyme [Klenkia soli]SDO77530.1 TIGR03083 family protein [Klenkia soli]
MTLDHLALLQHGTASLAELLASADLAAPVPSCPGWSLADLGRHTGSVHLWAREALRGDRAPDEQPGPADDAAVPAFYADAAGLLLEALRTTPPTTPCWTLDRTDRTAASWSRRQAHEVTLHHHDATSALGEPAAIPAPVALDGVDEVLGLFLPRQVRLGRVTATDDVVHLTPAESGAVLPVGTGDLAAAPVGTVAGPAEALLLLLWRRITPSDDRVEIRGDRSAVAAVLDRPLTP